jgi:hypothetical protein
MRSALVTACAAAALVPFSAQPASACTCLTTEPEALSEAADIVFTGTAVEVFPDLNLGAPADVATFAVDTAYKGDVRDRMKIVTPARSASCGVGFRTGVRYTVFAQEGQFGLETTRCDATTEGEVDVDRFGLQATPVAPPLSPEAAPAAPPRGKGGAWWPWVLLGLLMAGGLGYLALRRAS